MRKFYLLVLLAVSMTVAAQDKMTLDAQLLTNQQQALEGQGRRSANADENPFLQSRTSSRGLRR